MDNINLLPFDSIDGRFVPEEFLGEGKDQYYFRNKQFSKTSAKWRNLTSDEIDTLIKNQNRCNQWEMIYVTDKFDASLVYNNEFYGFIRIGRMTKAVLEHHDMQMPVGITNSRIISCDIGDDVVISNVHYLGHYIIGDRCILANIDEMHTTNHAKFGNGIIKDGEDESVRITVDIINETGSRGVLPFDGMIAADAYLWAKYRDDKKLQQKLKEITQNSFDSARGYYGTVGQQCVIKNNRIIKDVKIGSHCYIKGVNKLKNLTINSSEDEPSQIGEGVELVNGIIGYGCHIFYGCKAVRFVIGRNSNLKYGARLIHSVLGDNSTISCCEVLHNLIFGSHQQHHNNSFLIASVVMGQSNIAAGATIGSNHNSRANDGEIQAGRGFWPGLCTSLRHSSRFASFVLIANGNYPAQLDIRLPFSLVSNNETKGQLEIMPAYWWLYNMYALARNAAKFKLRDKRKAKVQNIEFDAFAPDTIEEIIAATKILEKYNAKESACDLKVPAGDMEKSKRDVIIIKPAAGYKAYKEMLLHYAVKNLIKYMNENSTIDFAAMCETLAGERICNWSNIGGQLIPASDVDKLRADVCSGKLDSWQKIHERYDELWRQYPMQKYKHAFAVLCLLCQTETLNKNTWFEMLDKAADIQDYICKQVYNSRKKDFENPFRQATYRNSDEMTAAIGTIEDNSFVRQVRAETEQFKKVVEEIKNRS